MSATADSAGVAWRDDPLWYKDAVIYQVHVRSFFDHNNDGVGDFPGLTDKLDYIQQLGVNAIWLLPFYPSPMRDDGYDIADYHGINPVYGTRRDFRQFVREAHKRDLKIITELVINHTSDQHPWFQAARRAPKGSSKRNFYVWSDTDKALAGTRIIFTDTEDSNWAWDPVAQQYYWHRFFSHQPDLNHNNPKVVEAMIRVMRYWLDMGVDGMRLDAIPYLCVREGTSNENLPETHEVVRRIRAAVDAHYKNRMLLAEANQWPEDVREYFGNGDECHMAYHFPLMPRMYMAIAQEDRHPIVEIIEQTPEIPPNCQWAIFLRNHDELTLEMVTDRERDYMYQTYAADPRMRVNVGIRRRLAPLMDNDMAKIQLMKSFLFSMPGSPIMYYGDELGMGDNIFLGDRNSVRTPMQWSPDRNGGFSRADPEKLFLPPIMDPVYGYQAVNVEAQSREPASLLNWTRRILNIRQGYKAFGRGRLRFLRPGNRKILAYLREYENEVLLCVANLKRTPQAVELDLSEFRGMVPIELLGRSPFPPIGELPYLLTLPGHGFYWFELASGADAPSWHQEFLVGEELPWLVLFAGLASFEQPEGEAASRARQRLIERFETDAAPRYLRQQRWFAGKGSELERVSLADAWVWRAARGEWLVAFVEAVLGGGERQRYFMPLAVDWSSEQTGPAAGAALARVRQQAQTGLLFDAFVEPRFGRDALEALRDRRTLSWPSGTIEFIPTSALGELTREEIEAAPVRSVGAGSNAAFVFGDRLFIKAYRRLRPGVNPEWEMNRFLTEVSPCSAVVPAVGAIEHRTPDGERYTLVLLQAALANQGDGWQYTLQYLERYLDDVLTRGADAAAEAGVTHGAYLLFVRTLAVRTADLHRALAVTTGDPAFDPEPLAGAWLERWHARVQQDIDDTLRLLAQRRADVAGADARAVDRLLAEPDALRARVTELARPVEALATRYHGDFHLGQVLVREGDVAIIDFEGEPGRTFAERRAKGTVLKDVAGMLRSFDYALGAAAQRFAEQRRFDAAVYEPLLREWRDAVRAAFLERYRAAMRGNAAYPAQADAARLIELATIEKLLYEIRYELANRPDWLSIPLRGLAELLQPAEPA
ncbi:MAG TPA: maltose alpha-D-glucosyltransferase [Gammaproteobacteria bacterium]